MNSQQGNQLTPFIFFSPADTYYLVIPFTLTLNGIQQPVPSFGSITLNNTNARYIFRYETSLVIFYNL